LDETALRVSKAKSAIENVKRNLRYGISHQQQQYAQARYQSEALTKSANEKAIRIGGSRWTICHFDRPSTSNSVLQRK
jgi:hypothetical protein